jgi:hypothetical protein
MDNKDENWYLRSLQNIADSVGNIKLKRSDSIKKIMNESFDIKISSDQSKKIISMLDKTLEEDEKISYLEDELSSILENVDNFTIKKISNYLYNYTN